MEKRLHLRAQLLAVCAHACLRARASQARGFAAQGDHLLVADPLPSLSPPPPTSWGSRASEQCWRPGQDWAQAGRQCLDRPEGCRPPLAGERPAGGVGGAIPRDRIFQITPPCPLTSLAYMEI